MAAPGCLYQNHPAINSVSQLANRSLKHGLRAANKTPTLNADLARNEGSAGAAATSAAAVAGDQRDDDGAVDDEAERVRCSSGPASASAHSADSRSSTIFLCAIASARMRSSALSDSPTALMNGQPKKSARLNQIFSAGPMRASRSCAEPPGPSMASRNQAARLGPRDRARPRPARPSTRKLVQRGLRGPGRSTMASTPTELTP